jgi:hypothetical protein
LNWTAVSKVTLEIPLTWVRIWFVIVANFGSVARGFPAHVVPKVSQTTIGWTLNSAAVAGLARANPNPHTIASAAAKPKPLKRFVTNNDIPSIGQNASALSVRPTARLFTTSPPATDCEAGGASYEQYGRAGKRHLRGLRVRRARVEHREHHCRNQAPH